MSIPAPYSYVKRVCKEFLMNEWNSYWKNFTTGKRTKEILPSPNLDLLTSNKYVIYLFTNHGPFPAYLCRFKILNNPDCLCGEHGDVDHYLTSCGYNGMAVTPWVTLPGEKTPDVHRPFHPGPPPPPR
ncbi:hypothetical protein AVEN_22446-1 [Araneus ventricosus]|uniref:Uncharacterized protein n=1 Tax=Araneus ventricosus TaxID=182803 RepID=A0A4Y2HRU5_ARAVE|nr:hypothetical protein AVEN_22446-1 [Araneus ventricosus]